MMSDWIAEARQITDATTEGPWKVATYEGAVITEGNVGEIVADHGNFTGSAADARFIVWARNVMPAMLDALEAAERLTHHMDENWLETANKGPCDDAFWDGWVSEREALIIQSADALARVRDTIGEQQTYDS